MLSDQQWAAVADYYGYSPSEIQALKSTGYTRSPQGFGSIQTSVLRQMRSHGFTTLGQWQAWKRRIALSQWERANPNATEAEKDAHERKLMRRQGGKPYDFGIDGFINPEALFDRASNSSTFGAGEVKTLKHIFGATDDQILEYASNNPGAKIITGPRGGKWIASNRQGQSKLVNVSTGEWHPTAVFSDNQIYLNPPNNGFSGPLNARLTQSNFHVHDDGTTSLSSIEIDGERHNVGLDGTVEGLPEYQVQGTNVLQNGENIGSVSNLGVISSSPQQQPGTAPGDQTQSTNDGQTPPTISDAVQGTGADGTGSGTGTGDQQVQLSNDPRVIFHDETTGQFVLAPEGSTPQQIAQMRQDFNQYVNQNSRYGGVYGTSANPIQSAIQQLNDPNDRGYNLQVGYGTPPQVDTQGNPATPDGTANVNGPSNTPPATGTTATGTGGSTINDFINNENNLPGNQQPTDAGPGYGTTFGNRQWGIIQGPNGNRYSVGNNGQLIAVDDYPELGLTANQELPDFRIDDNGNIFYVNPSSGEAQLRQQVNPETGISQRVAAGANLQTGYQPEAYDYTASPGYQFAFNEGLRALNRGYSAAGQRLSGNRAAGLQQYGQQLATTQFDNDFNRLAQLAGFGQGATNVVSNAASNTGNTIGNIFAQTGAANANLANQGGQFAAAGQLGSSRAFAGTAQTIGNAIGNFFQGGNTSGTYDPSRGNNRFDF